MRRWGSSEPSMDTSTIGMGQGLGNMSLKGTNTPWSRPRPCFNVRVRILFYCQMRFKRWDELVLKARRFEKRLPEIPCFQTLLDTFLAGNCSNHTTSDFAHSSLLFKINFLRAMRQRVWGWLPSIWPCVSQCALNTTIALGLYFSINVFPKSLRNSAFGPFGPPIESSGNLDGNRSGQINNGAINTESVIFCYCAGDREGCKYIHEQRRMRGFVLRWVEHQELLSTSFDPDCR